MNYSSRSNYKKDAPEFNSGERLTVPDQSLTPAEILVKFAKNMGSSVPRFEPSYTTLEDVSKLSIEELHTHSQDLKERIKQLQKIQRQKQRDEFEAEVLADYHKKTKPQAKKDEASAEDKAL